MCIIHALSRVVCARAQLQSANMLPGRVLAKSQDPGIFPDGIRQKFESRDFTQTVQDLS